jgi:hypothetical protein
VQAEDYYQLLGVNRHASRETLRHAFRTKMLDLHPDLHPNDTLACEQTRQLVDAYKTLNDPKARKSYDNSLARLDIPELDWTYSEYGESGQWARHAVILVFAALAVVLLVWAIRSTADNRLPVYRFQLTELWTDIQPRHVALLVEPSIRDGMEWYQTVEYQVTASSALVAQETTAAYERAIQAAERKGDRVAAQFYRSSLREMRRAQTTGAPLGEYTDYGPDENPDGNIADPGAKPSAGSSKA